MATTMLMICNTTYIFFAQESKVPGVRIKAQSQLQREFNNPVSLRFTYHSMSMTHAQSVGWIFFEGKTWNAEKNPLH